MDLGPEQVRTSERDAALGAVYGHANAVGAEAVGAADYPETPAFGRAPAALEPFPSAGGVAILFDRTGPSPHKPCAPSPGVVAPGGVSTTFFFADREDDEDGFPNFYGTSAVDLPRVK